MGYGHRVSLEPVRWKKAGDVIKFCVRELVLPLIYLGSAHQWEPTTYTKEAVQKYLKMMRTNA